MLSKVLQLLLLHRRADWRSKFNRQSVGLRTSVNMHCWQQSYSFFVVTLGKGHRFNLLENKVLRRTLWPKRKEVNRERIKSLDEVIRVLYGIKCTIVQALSLCTGRTAHRGSRSITLLFLDHGTRRGWGVSVTPRPLFTPRKGPVPIVQKTGWAPGPVWTGAKNLLPTEIRSPDRPTRSQSLYCLRYPAHFLWHNRF